MIDHKVLFDTIDTLNSEFIEKWINVSKLQSPTDYKEGVDKVGNYFYEYAKKMGWQTEVFEQSVAGNCICITMNPQSDNKPIALSGHMDTVHPVGSFGNLPVKTDGEKIYGPGVMDCKGGIVAALLAMTALHKIGFTTRPIMLILQSDEESNSKHSEKATINYICNKAKDSIAFLNCESIRGNTAVLWRKGICRYRLNVSGKSVHASRCTEGASAIAEAAYKIIELEKMKNADGITCNCGIINGGSTENTVPESCSLFAEIRFNNNEEWKIAEETVKAVAEKSFVEGTSCELLKTISRPAMEKTDRNFELLERLNGIYSKCGLPELTSRQSLGGSDAAEVIQAGIPCIDSIGVAGDKIHTTEEFAFLSSLKEAAKRIAAACFYI